MERETSVRSKWTNSTQNPESIPNTCQCVCREHNSHMSVAPASVKWMKPKHNRVWRTVRTQIWQDQSMENAGLLSGTARERDSFNTVERISDIHLYRRHWLLTPRQRLYPFGHVPAALVLPICGCSRSAVGKARTYYETEAIRAGWSVRQLDRQIGSQFYERIALSRNKAAMLE